MQDSMQVRIAIFIRTYTLENKFRKERLIYQNNIVIRLFNHTSVFVLDLK